MGLFSPPLHLQVLFVALGAGWGFSEGFQWGAGGPQLPDLGKVRPIAAGIAAAVVLSSSGGRFDPQDLVGSLSQPPAAFALTEEQEVIADASRVVKRGFVDKSYNNQDWDAVRLKYLRREYHDKQEAYRGAAEMLKTLGDPFTRFLTPDEYETLAGLARGGTGSAQGNAGVGVEMMYGKDDLAVVSSVIEGSPAASGGVLAGDIIKSVDGVAVSGKSLDSVAALLRGSSGTDVRLGLQRGGKTVDVATKRAEIRFAGVSSALELQGRHKMGIVTIKTFSKDTADDVLKAIEELESQGATDLVVDLRHNPGGYFPGGIDTARLFLAADLPIVSVVDRNGIADTYSTIVSGIETSKPLYLAVDEKTASASEIFSAALQDNHRAKLVGRKTFGKARVQTLNQLYDGSGVAVTVSVYKTPSGRDINKIGIDVDVAKDCEYPGPVLQCLPPSAFD